MRRDWPSDSRKALVVVCLGLFAVCETTVAAMVTVPAEFGVMVTESQVVVHGRVMDVQAYETAGRRTIETRVAVQVVESLKGDVSGVVYFRIPGGQVGRYRRVMVGAPRFVPGEEVVVFLKGRAPSLPMPFGLTQGVYRVMRGDDGRAVVTPLVTTDAARVTRGDPARRPLNLEVFTSLVRTRVGVQP